jgi:hypothetical protein
MREAPRTREPLRDCLANDLLQLRQAGRYITAEMNAQGPPVAVGEDLEIPASLGRFHDAERIFLAGHGKIGSIVAGDLQEDAGIRAAFIGLPGGMEKSRAEAEAGGNTLLVANGVAKRLQLPFVRIVPLDVAKDGEIIAGTDAAQMRAQIADKTSVAAHGLLERGSVLFVGE